MRSATTKYPVFYLLHGAGDSDDSWTSVGRAGFILDNLIADKKAKPMVVVMPAGHTLRGQAAGRNATQEFVSDFNSDVDAVRREELPRARPIARTPRSPACRWAATRRCRWPFRSSRSSATSASTARACSARFPA